MIHVVVWYIVFRYVTQSLSVGRCGGYLKVVCFMREVIEVIEAMTGCFFVFMMADQRLAVPNSMPVWCVA